MTRSGAGACGFEVRVDVLVEREFVVGEGELREQRILVEHEIGDDAPGEQVLLLQIGSWFTRWNRKNSCVASA